MQRGLGLAPDAVRRWALPRAVPVRARVRHHRKTGRRPHRAHPCLHDHQAIATQLQ